MPDNAPEIMTDRPSVRKTIEDFISNNSETEDDVVQIAVVKAGHRLIIITNAPMPSTLGLLLSAAQNEIDKIPPDAFSANVTTLPDAESESCSS